MATRLTANVKAGGCASKLSPKILNQALKTVPRVTNERVLVGYDTADDAGVYDLTEVEGKPLAKMQAADFVAPIGDVPYTYGRIGVASALIFINTKDGPP